MLETRLAYIWRTGGASNGCVQTGQTNQHNVHKGVRDDYVLVETLVIEEDVVLLVVVLNV